MRAMLVCGTILTFHACVVVLGAWIDIVQSVKINLSQDEPDKASSARVVRHETSLRFSPGESSEIKSSEAEYRLSYKEYETTWQLYKLKHGKSYGSLEEELKRFSIFQENAQLIELHNQKFHLGLSTFWMDLNQFSDWTESEMQAMMLTHEDSKHIQMDLRGRCEEHLAQNVRAPASVDWRKQGYVTDVKHQGQCGSCWAFSATGTLEGQWAKNRGHLKDLSEQQLVDCSSGFGNQGCNGGWPARAIEYIQSSGGVEEESDYPYLAKQGECSFNASQVAAKVKGCRIVGRNESALKEAVASVGPISVVITVSRKFMKYSRGVFVDDVCASLGLHAVLVVGYGRDNRGRDYWIIKNSWGTTWGENGYVRMARNRRNMCGVANTPIYPVI